MPLGTIRHTLRPPPETPGAQRVVLVLLPRNSGSRSCGTTGGEWRGLASGHSREAAPPATRGVQAGPGARSCRPAMLCASFCLWHSACLHPSPGL